MSRLAGGRLGAAAMAAAVAVVSGCAGVPSSSAPRVIEDVPNTAFSDEPDVRSYPRAPEQGGLPDRIVRDFLSASGSPERQHEVARRYLTRQAATTWLDQAGAVVLAQELTVSVQSDGREVVVRGEEQGRLDAAGTYTSSPSRPYNFLFRLDREAGEWRITNPPPGVVVSASTFEQSYQPFNVYFLDPTQSRVVPDPRWLATPRGSEANVLLNALLEGPSPYLQGAVRTALDELSQPQNVVPENDRLRVFLSGLGELGKGEQVAAAAQIVWTLGQLGMPGIEIYDDNELLGLPNGERVQLFGEWQNYNPDGLRLETSGYFVRNGAVWTTRGKPMPGPLGRGSYAARSVGVSRDLARVAVVGNLDRGVALYLGQSARGQLAARLTGRSLAPPTWSPAADEVWTVRDGRAIVAIPWTGEPVPVTAAGLERIGRISVVRLSRDGTRAAVVAGRPGNRGLYVGTVIRRPGSSVIDQLQRIQATLPDIIDVSWSSATRLVALVRGGPSANSLWSISIDGASRDELNQDGLVKSPSAVSAAPNLPMLAAAADRIWSRSDRAGTWSSIARSATGRDSAPAYPG